VAAGPKLPSGTVTFLFTDIEGSTGLVKQLGDRYAAVLDDHRRLLREAFAAQGGREIDTQGDSFFFVFARAKSAIVAAIDAQRALGAHEWPEGAVVRVRMGLHSGEPLVGEDRYVGIGVNRAARVGAAAHGGQVLVSDATRALVEDDLPEGVFLRDLGTHRLKDIERPERISQVAAEGLKTEFSPLRAVEVKSKPVLRRRSVLAAALVGVIAAAVAIPVFALGSGDSGGSTSVADVGANALGVLDASSGRLLASRSLGTTPGSVTASGGSVWVTDPQSGTVIRVDVRSSLRQAIPVGNDPSAIAVGDGFVWVANALSGTVSKVDPNANGGAGAVVDTIPVGNGPEGVAFGAGRLWVANSTDRTVMEFVPGSHRPVRTIPVASGADAIAFGNRFVWVVSGAGNSVTRIDARSGTPLPAISVGNGPTAVAVGAGAGWVTNSQDGTVSRIDPSSGAVTGVAVGGSPTGVAAGTTSVWVSDQRAGTLTRIDPGDDKVAQTLRTSNRPGALALASGPLYVAVSATSHAHRGGTLTLVTDPFDSIDPAVTYSLTSWPAMIMAYDGLVTFQRVGGSNGTRIVPDLATTLPAISDGGRTYTFQVRSGIRYSTGELVQPADFRRAIERSVALGLANPPITPGGTTGFYFSDIVGADTCTAKHCDLSRGIVTDQSSRTVTFHLTKPDADFLDKLAISSAYAVPARIPLNARPPIPGTGPYMIAKYNAKQGITLVRNPHFHEWSATAQPSGYPDKIVWKFGQDTPSGSMTPHAQAAAIRAVKQNKIDYTNQAYAEVPALRTEGFGSQVHVNTALNTLYFYLNTSLPPFKSRQARQAINYAVNRNRLAAFFAPTLPTCQVLPPNFAGYARYCPYPHDIAKARRLVAASGTAGQSVTVRTGPFLAPAGSYLVSVLRRLGYKARLRELRAQDYYAANLAHSTQTWQVGGLGWNADYPSPTDFFRPLLTCTSYHHPRSGDANANGFCDPQIDDQITRALALQTSDPQAAATLWSKIDRAVVNEAPWVTLGNNENVDFVSKRVRNYQYNPQWGPLFDQMWVR
jgi:peptide/nickel transport system substrate-binding protein